MDGVVNRCGIRSAIVKIIECKCGLVLGFDNDSVSTTTKLRQRLSFDNDSVSTMATFRQGLQLFRRTR